MLRSLLLMSRILEMEKSLVFLRKMLSSLRSVASSYLFSSPHSSCRKLLRFCLLL